MRVNLASIDNFENSQLLLFSWQVNYFIIQYFTIVFFSKIKKLLTIIIIIIIIIVIIIITIIIITRIIMIIKYQDLGKSLEQVPRCWSGSRQNFGFRASIQIPDVQNLPQLRNEILQYCDYPNLVRPLIQRTLFQIISWL